jgi:alkylated DNA repair dioxygenase AlkB
MTVDFQATLFDDPVATETPAPTLGALGRTVRRTRLSAGAWVDVRPGWATASDDVFLQLVREVPWHAERRQMYDRVVDVPRLLKFYGPGEPLPHPLLAEARDRLSAHYADELGEPFATAGLCYYRDGRDSVAWHGDTIGRSRTEDTMVAIVSFGEARRLLLRPKPGGPSRGVGVQDGGHGPERDRGGDGSTLAFSLGHGDLLVMGGSCQRTWEHAVPKTARPAGPRISVQFRPAASAEGRAR